MSTLKTADRSGCRKNYPRSRPVEQYDLHGHLVAEFPSIKAASRQTRIEDKAIIRVAKGLYRQWNEFVFRYMDGDSAKKKQKKTSKYLVPGTKYISSVAGPEKIRALCTQS